MFSTSGKCINQSQTTFFHAFKLGKCLKKLMNSLKKYPTMKKYIEQHLKKLNNSECSSSLNEVLSQNIIARDQIFWR